MTTARSRILLAIVGFFGVVILSASFAINPGPPAGLSNAQIMVWGAQNKVLIEAGAWAQIVGSFLQVAFTLGILYMTGIFRHYLGLLVASAVLLIMGISLVESSFYLNAVASGVSGDMEALHIAMNLITAIQHAYTILPASVFDGGLGLVLLSTPLFKGRFGRILGYLGLTFGVVILILGFLNTFQPLQDTVNTVLSVQQVWLLAVTVLVGLTARQVSGEVQAPEEPNAMAG